MGRNSKTDKPRKKEKQLRGGGRSVGSFVAIDRSVGKSNENSNIYMDKPPPVFLATWQAPQRGPTVFERRLDR